MARSVTFVIEGTVDTQITITENLDGTLTFDVSVIGGVIGDLRGLFFDVAAPNKLAGVSIVGNDVKEALNIIGVAGRFGGRGPISGSGTRCGNGLGWRNSVLPGFPVRFAGPRQIPGVIRPEIA